MRVISVAAAIAGGCCFSSVIDYRHGKNYLMSAIATLRTCLVCHRMSALRGKAEVDIGPQDVRF